jgi:SAM-dependent methyltransferase
MQKMKKHVESNLESIRPFLNKPPIAEHAGKWYFRNADRSKETKDSFDRIKLFFKKYPNFYYSLIVIISPVQGNYKTIKKFISDSNGVVINIGSGNQVMRQGVINIDMMNYDNVDIVADIQDLPFRANTLDAVINIAVLEHVLEPSTVLKEVHRVLKPGGRVYTCIPFMQPFHASPHDYQRYTLPGIRYLHKDFEIIESGVAAGPVSGLLWVFQEAFASIFSFGNPFARNLLTILVMLLTWPIKFLDIIFSRLKTAENVASAFYVIAEKRSDLKLAKTSSIHQ